MYRLVCYDKKGKFHHLCIEETLDDAVRKRYQWAQKIGVKEDYMPFPNIYKCNSKGNNYTHREVWV